MNAREHVPVLLDDVNDQLRATEWYRSGVVDQGALISPRETDLEWSIHRYIAEAREYSNAAGRVGFFDLSSRRL